MKDENLLTDHHLTELLEKEASEIDGKLDLWPLIQQQLQVRPTPFEPTNDENSPLLEPLTTGPKPLLTFPHVARIFLGMAAALALAFMIGAVLMLNTNNTGTVSIPLPIAASVPPVVNPTVPVRPHPVTGTLQATLTGNTDAVRALSWKPNGTLLASGADDGTLKIWDMTGKLLDNIIPSAPVSGWPYMVTWSGSDSVVSITSNSTQFPSFNGMLMAARISESEFKVQQPDGKVITTLSSAGGTIGQLAWSPDSKIIAGEGFAAHGSGPAGPGDVRVWFWRTNGSLFATLKSFSFPINSMGWSADSKILAIAAKGENQAGLWSDEGKPLLGFGEGYVIWSLAWSPDGQTLAAACSDNMVRLLNKAGALEATLTGHQDSVWTVAWSPDGKTLASGSGDKTVKLWQIK